MNESRETHRCQQDDLESEKIGEPPNTARVHLHACKRECGSEQPEPRENDEEPSHPPSGEKGTTVQVANRAVDQEHADNGRKDTQQGEDRRCQRIEDVP
jgi:hypothetical protein